MKKTICFIVVLVMLIQAGAIGAAASEPQQAAAETKQVLYPMSRLVGETYLWGYIDTSGKFVIEPKYSYASEWNGLGYGIVALPETPSECAIIDMREKVISFKHPYLQPGREGAEVKSFQFFFDNGVPSARWIGSYLIVPDFVGDPYAPHLVYNLKNQELLTGGQLISFSEGMIGCWTHDTITYFNQSGASILSDRGNGGLFFDGVAAVDFLQGSYYLYNSKGEMVYRFSEPKGFTFYARSGSFAVGDSLVTVKVVSGKNGSYELYGVMKADGTKILPLEYAYVKLMPNKQILTSKKGEPYTLRNASGKTVYQFPTYMTGAFQYDGAGHYMYRDTSNMLNVLASSGALKARFPIAKGAEINFMNELIQVKEVSGKCSYFDLKGKSVYQ